jgi:hypothetical protein
VGKCKSGDLCVYYEKAAVSAENNKTRAGSLY